MSQMTIGEVAQRAKLRPSAIRYYESLGLLPEPERISGRRRYDASVLSTLRFIQMAQQIGFSLPEIRALLYSFPTGTPPGERWQLFAQQKIAETEAIIQEAIERKTKLERTLNCDCYSLERCVEGLAG